ncbi:MAG: peptidylprolyl isomerase [Terricaulis sp.]
MALQKRASLTVAALTALAFLLSACGLGRDSSEDNGHGIRNPVVAATVNGRAIYVEDVRAHAVARGLLQEGEELDPSSDAFYFSLEELIQFRLFAMEAEARGLDRQPDVRRQLENARDQVLAAAIYEEIDQHATDPKAVERLYNENVARLGQGQEIHLRHISFDTKEAADAAKRRMEVGHERFEALAFELSTDRELAADGGDLGWGAVSDLSAAWRAATENASVGNLLGPVLLDNKWELVRVEDRRERGQQSLEALRPRIIDWLRFQQITQLQERLERDARIERMPAGGPSTPPGSPSSPPAGGSPTTTTETPRPVPDAAAHPGQAPPPFPFPMGSGASSANTPPPPSPTAPVENPHPSTTTPSTGVAHAPASGTTSTTTSAPSGQTP